MSTYDKNLWYKDTDNNYKTDCKWSHPPAYEQGCFINKIFPVYEKHIHRFDWRYLQSFQNDLKCLLVPLWYNFGSVLDRFWHHVGIILG